jgi:hypothetical protein
VSFLGRDEGGGGAFGEAGSAGAPRARPSQAVGAEERGEQYPTGASALRAQSRERSEQCEGKRTLKKRHWRHNNRAEKEHLRATTKLSEARRETSTTPTARETSTSSGAKARKTPTTLKSYLKKRAYEGGFLPECALLNTLFRVVELLAFFRA